MITPYTPIQTIEDLQAVLAKDGEFITSIADNTVFVMKHLLDVDEESFVEYDANSATIVGLFMKQYRLFKYFVPFSKTNDLELCVILFRIIYEAYIKMLYLIKHGDTAQKEYRLLSYKDRYQFYEVYKDEKHGYFNVRNKKFLEDLSSDGFTIEELQSAISNKTKAFGGKNFRQLLAEFEDERLYSALYGIGSDPIHSDWGEIRNLFVRNVSNTSYIADVDYSVKVADRYTISVCLIMIDSALKYAEWAKDIIPCVSTYKRLLEELERVGKLYSELVMKEYNKPNSKYMFE